MNYLGANMKLIVECSQKLVRLGENLWGKEQKLDKAEPLDVPTMTTEFIKEIGGLVEEEALKQYEVPTGSIKIWDLPDGYQFTDENGNVINATKIVLEKKKKGYPKTYEECCKVLDWNHRDYDRVGYKSELLCKLQVLLLCRDAYWKIAGEEMGLGKPWEPDWLDDDTKKYVITSSKVFETFGGLGYINYILTFPTEEMRDAFYENFKEEIEKCKELL